jgi:zinc protease
VAVLNTLLGGLFNSRLNRLLREERGYTYGVHSSFDMRRYAGPFAVRCAVETEVTAPAVEDIMAELGRIREAPVVPDELATTRDTGGRLSAAVRVGCAGGAALAGLVLYELPDDGHRYRPGCAEVVSNGSWPRRGASGPMRRPSSSSEMRPVRRFARGAGVGR